MAVAEAQSTKIAGTRKRRSNRLGILATQIGILVAILGCWQFAVTDASNFYLSLEWRP